MEEPSSTSTTTIIDDNNKNNAAATCNNNNDSSTCASLSSSTVSNWLYDDLLPLPYETYIFRGSVNRIFTCVTNQYNKMPINDGTYTQIEDTKLYYQRIQIYESKE